MFAGAAREAVFSHPEVIARIERDYVPVALKAGRVANPPAGIEGDLYRELKRTQPAPQGICVANSSGKVLAWSLMFEDDASVLKFLDHGVHRYGKSPDASQPTAAERFMRFPQHKLAEVLDDGKRPEIPETHAGEDHCPGDLPSEEGSILAKVVGRALDAEGKPLADARTQDHYVEDRFEIPRSMQRALLRSMRVADGKDFAVPGGLGRLMASHAYLGMLDVNPLGGIATGGKVTGDEIRLWARRAGESTRIELWGKSSVSGTQRTSGDGNDGRRWNHLVRLDWRGLIQLNDGGDAIRALALLAEGEEELQWNIHQKGSAQGSAVASLPAGRPIAFAGRVRYGITSGD